MDKVIEGMKFFDEHMEESDMANLLLHCLQDDSEKLATFMEELGINEQLKKKKAIIEAKSKNQWQTKNAYLLGFSRNHII